jgi:LacI family transcriptional regulator
MVTPTTETRIPVRTGATLADVAEAVGLHPSTVSRALDPGRASMVKAETRERVLEAAERIGYRPNLAARSLMTGRTATVAVIAADLGNPWVTPIIHGIASRMHDDGVVPIVAETDDQPGALAELVDHMVARRVDALIVLAGREGDQDVVRSAGQVVPTVVAARPLPGAGVGAVISDGKMGGALVASHLADLGHTHVAQLRGPSNVLNFPLRSRGFSSVAKARGLRETHLEMEVTSTKVEDGAALMEHLLATTGDDHPTAVFAHNDSMALGAISVLKRHGLAIPGDVAVAGFNDSPMTEHLTPGLTTVHYPGWEVGHAAADAALRLLEGDISLASIEIDQELIIRGSTDPTKA